MSTKIFASAAALFLFFCASAFAPKKKTTAVLNPKIEQRFLEEFGDQPNVEWSNSDNNLIQASFVVDNQTAQAFFDKEGNYVLSTMQVSKNSLPLKLRLAADKQLANESINAILQMNNSEETAYFFQTTNEQGTKVWKGYASGTISLFKKLK